jgi:hypothetical protein
MNSINLTTADVTTKISLTRPFHHDRGRLVFAVSPRRGEQGALADERKAQMAFGHKTSTMTATILTQKDAK